jgi:hypothetical protein
MGLLPADKNLDAEFAKESARLCKELNSRDPTTILGLATNLWPGARQAKVTGVMRERLLIGAMGHSPIREELTYPFEPPLASVEEAAARVAALRADALRPGFDALSSSLSVLLATALLGAYFTEWRLFDVVRRLARSLFGRYDAAVMELCVNFCFAVTPRRPLMPAFWRGRSGWNFSPLSAGVVGRSSRAWARSGG